MATSAAGWEAVVDGSTGNTYYFHAETGQTSWEPPPGFATLPAGWEAVTDPATGNIYYFNGSTGETSWTVPGGGGEDDTVSVALRGGDDDEDDDRAKASVSRGLRRRNSGSLNKSRGASAARGKSRERGKSSGRPSFLGGPTLSVGPGRMDGFGSSALAEAGRSGGGGGSGGGEDEDEEDWPEEEDPSFEAKVRRFQLHEAKVATLQRQAAFHKEALEKAFAADAVFAQQAVRLVGAQEPALRAAAAGAWAGSASAAATVANYCGEVERSLLATLAADAEAAKAVNAAIKDRAVVEKEFSHYIKKLAELRMEAAKGKVDKKKLERNQVRDDSNLPQRSAIINES